MLSLAQEEICVSMTARFAYADLVPAQILLGKKCYVCEQHQRKLYKNKHFQN